MCLRLLDREYDVFVYDVNPQALEQFLGTPARPVSSIAELAGGHGGSTHWGRETGAGGHELKYRLPRLFARVRNAGEPAAADRSYGSGGLKIDGAGLAAIVFQLVPGGLILVERVHPGLLDRADVHEGVVAAALGRDEAVAFGGIEEFYGADRHKDIPSCSADRQPVHQELG